MSDSNIADAIVGLSLEEKAASNVLATFIGSVGAGYIGTKLDFPRVIMALKGQSIPPGWLADAADKYLGLATRPFFGQMVNATIPALLTSNGSSVDALANLLRRVASQVGIDSDDSDPLSYIVNILGLMSKKVLEASNKEKFLGVVTCPRCKYVHLV